MTADALVTVFCNAPKCGRWDEEAGVGPTAAEARRGLRSRGWRLAVPDPSGGRRLLDFCPLHVDTDPARAT